MDRSRKLAAVPLSCGSLTSSEPQGNLNFYCPSVKAIVQSRSAFIAPISNCCLRTSWSEECAFMSPCTCPRSQYIYNASAYGFSAEFHRPLRHSIPTQAGAVLGAEGGRGTGQVKDFIFDSLVSVKDAHTEVGGSYD